MFLCTAKEKEKKEKYREIFLTACNSNFNRKITDIRTIIEKREIIPLVAFTIVIFEQYFERTRNYLGKNGRLRIEIKIVIDARGKLIAQISRSRQVAFVHETKRERKEREKKEEKEKHFFTLAI